MKLGQGYAEGELYEAEGGNKWKRDGFLQVFPEAKYVSEN